MDELDRKVAEVFKIYVRKDLTRGLKAQWPEIPAYVLEYYLAKYCSTADEVALAMGQEVIQREIGERYFKSRGPDGLAAELKARGRVEVLDRVSLRQEGTGQRAFLDHANCGDLRVSNQVVERLTEGRRLGVGEIGAWAEVRLSQSSDSDSIRVEDLRPIELAQFDIQAFFTARARFELREWTDLLVRTLGYEPQGLEPRAKELLLCRLLPFFEPGLNLLEIGPPGRGKSYVFGQVSPAVGRVDSHRVSAARIFGHAASDQPGLVGRCDVVAFDPAAVVDRMPDDVRRLIVRYASTGEYERGRNVGRGAAGLVFLVEREGPDAGPGDLPRALGGNLDLLGALDFLVPGWELPRLGPERTTEHLGLPLEVLAKAARTLRSSDRADPLLAFDCGEAVGDADKRAIRKVLRSLLKLFFPHAEPAAAERVHLLELAAEGRQRVKVLLRRAGSVAHFATKFRFTERATGRDVEIVGSAFGSFLGGEPTPAGVVLVAGLSPGGVVGLRRLEVNSLPGAGDLELVGVPAGAHEASIRAALGFLHENAHSFGVADELARSHFQVQSRDLIGNGDATGVGVGALLAMCSALRSVPIPEGSAVVGDMTGKGSLIETPSHEALEAFLREGGVRATWIPMPKGVGAKADGAPATKEGVTFYFSPKHAAKLMFGEALAPVPAVADWITTLPYPLASILDFYEATAEPKTRSTALLAFFECLAAFHAIVLLSGFAAAPDNETTLRGLTKELSFELGTFALWKETFSALAKKARGLRDVKRDELLRIFRVGRIELIDQLTSPELRAVFENANKLRNDWKGHDTVAVSDEQASSREAQLIPLLSQARRATPTIWSSYELVRARQIELDEGRWRCTLDRLRGPSPNFKPLSLEADSAMDSKRLYLVDREVGAPLLLVPLIRIGERSIAYFYDRRDARGIRWLSQHSKESNELIDSLPSTTSWLDKARCVDR